MMWSNSTRILSATMPVVLCASLLISAAVEASAQRRTVRTSGRTTGRVTSAANINNRRSRTALPATAPLPATVNPFEAVEAAEDTTGVVDVNFTRTPLDKRAKASGKVALRGGTLLAHIRAEDVPLPTSFGVPRYALWVYVPNHAIKVYIGDLPITPTSSTHGKSDSAYRFTALPSNAIYGGLMLTAEPIRYEPIVNEALRPVLVSLAEGVDPKDVGPALTLYTYPLPPTARRSSSVVRPASSTVQPTRTRGKKRSRAVSRRVRGN